MFSLRKRFWTSVFCICVVAFFFSSQAQAQDRVALLIGNSEYGRSDMDLRNPTNDVQALDGVLGRLGFSVKIIENGTRSDMMSGLAWLASEAVNSEMALVFFAGHGIQEAEENYLIGSDLSHLSYEALQTSSITLTEIRSTLAASGTELGMIILDACRNNPLADAGVGKMGLATARGGAGLLVAYATDPGNVAYDGSGDNSVFTSSLLEHITTPGLDVRLMFGRVRQDVLRDTFGRQIPWVEESVLGEHYLAGPPSNASQTDEIIAWRKATELGTQAAFDEYLQAYPDGLFKVFAQDSVQRLNQSAGAQRAEPVPAIELAGYEASSLYNALGLLGFTSVQRGISPDQRSEEVDLSEVERVFRLWQEKQLNPETANPELLLQDAARLSMFLAATTAQRIRTDMVIHSSIEKHLELARADVLEIRRLAQSMQEAKDLLAEVEADLDLIELHLEQVAKRLDASIAYYNNLVSDTFEHYKSELRVDLFWQNTGGSRSSSVEPSLFAYAEQFVEHVQASSDTAPGSLAWLTDFLQKG
jgi:uncharacterized caspase-like protein